MPTLEKRRAALGIKYGERLLKLISANLDDMRNTETLHEFDIGVNVANADISRIQETHNTTSGDKLTNNYRYISTADLQVAKQLNEKGNRRNGNYGKTRMSQQNLARNEKPAQMHESHFANRNAERKLHIVNTYAPQM